MAYKAWDLVSMYTVSLEKADKAGSNRLLLLDRWFPALEQTKHSFKKSPSGIYLTKNHLYYRIALITKKHHITRKPFSINHSVDGSLSAFSAA